MVTWVYQLELSPALMWSPAFPSTEAHLPLEFRAVS